MTRLLSRIHKPPLPGAIGLVAFGGLLAILFGADGCATSGSATRAPRPGDGLREYQRLVQELGKDVTQTRQAAEALMAATPKKSDAAFARFQESLHRLEVFSFKARARADAMEKRGEAYFEEWAEEIAGSKDEAARRAARQRFAELHTHFETILSDGRLVRQEFRRFLDDGRRLRTKLGAKPAAESIAQANPTLAQIVTEGRQAETAMGQLLNSLKAAEGAVMSVPAPIAKSGGKS